MTAFVLAIDNGSQSTKVHIMDAGGRVVASGRCPLRPYAYPAPGQVVHPDDDLWDSIRAACRAALDAFRGDPADIVAVGLCTIRFCRALLDADGALVEPVWSWMDARVASPHVADPRVAHVTTSSGYLTHRLTGEFVDTAANYAGLWPLDLATARWASDPQAFVETGMPRELLFDLVDPGGVLGRVTPAASEATGIRAGTPVYATANDKAVEALGAGIDDRTVLLSLGTYIAAMTVGPAPVGGPAHWVNFASVPGRYLFESNGIRRGMWTVSWARDLLFGAGVPVAPGESLEAILDAEASAVPPGSGGVLAVLDWLAPTDAPYRRGAFLGFDGTQGRGHLFRSVLEGIVLTMADNAEAMQRALGGGFDALVVTGGGAKSDLMMRVVADVFGRPARRAGLDDAAGMGAAICAAVGHGLHPTWDAAVAAMVRPGRVFTPDPAGVAAYADLRPRYRELHRFTDPLFEFLTGPAGSADAAVAVS